MGRQIPAVVVRSAPRVRRGLAVAGASQEKQGDVVDGVLPTAILAVPPGRRSRRMRTEHEALDNRS